ncbi:MAG: 1-deoxy-D-xylulose-5-phosphate reductoisomerase [Candidatus Cloacimonetes bacterium]|nr:1-deoxy-D-xylulose-5-phosphate reductoisomerase [Candidatus Cloacimonadota bacterium]
MKKKIAVLGITGSIGESVVEIVKYHSEVFEIVFASANSNLKKLQSIAQELKIKNIFLTDSQIKIDGVGKATDLIRFIENEDYDILINAISGSAGLPYTIATIKQGKDLALANKESLVMAGHLVSDIVSKKGSKIIPIDSEHSAIFQVLHGHQKSELKNIHLTASGGPFRTLPYEDFQKIELKQVLKHPTWDMGTKVTIDSATMMNKGLEVIEAHWLFDIDYKNIQAIIHPQSIIHSIVEFVDGSMIAQMSIPTMQLPILYALTYPIHYPSDKIKTSLESLSALTFEPICKKRYPLFYLVCEAGKIGGIMPTVLNAANEKAIDMFLQGKISFVDISKIVEESLNKFENIENPDLDTIMNVNEIVRK